MSFGAVCMTRLTRQTPFFLQEVYTAIAALGMGPLWTLTLLMIQACVSKDELATATTGFGLVRSLSGALGGTTIRSALRMTPLLTLESCSYDGFSAIFIATCHKASTYTWVLS
jgi:predicted membrane protein